MCAAGLFRTILNRDGTVRGAIRAVRLCTKINGAQLYRKVRYFDHVVGITGSAAKSTTTALVAEILQQYGRVHLGHGYNTFGAVAGQFWRSPLNAKFWVQEISGGMPDKMARPANFLRPTIAIVTTVQMDHIKQFDNEDHIAAEKAKLLDALSKNGVAVLNADDPRVLAMRERCEGREVITFGTGNEADIRALSWSEGLPGRLSVEVTDGVDKVCFNTRFAGARWIMAILAAVAGARAAGIGLSDCKAAIEKHNSEFTKDSIHILSDGTTMILDSFKGGMWTIPTSIKTLKLAKAVRKTMIVGTISDYRGSSGPKYRNTAKAALEVADKVIFYGPNSDRVIRLINDYPGRLQIFHRISELHAHLLSDSIPGELIYVKASKVDHLDRLLLNRLQPILCWLDKCGLKNACGKCKFLYGTRAQTKRIMNVLRL